MLLSVTPVGQMEANNSLYAYVGNDPVDRSDPSGLESVGEMIDSAAEGCGAVSCAGWAALSATWKVFGSESLSQVADKGWSNVGSGDRVGAGLEILSALPPVKIASEVAGAAKIGADVAKDGAVAAKSLGANPFKGKTSQEIGSMLEKKGYVPKGPDPVAGRGTYVNPKTERGYHIDANHPDPKGPHVGVHRPRALRDKMDTRDYPME